MGRSNLGIAEKIIWETESHESFHLHHNAKTNTPDSYCVSKKKKNISHFIFPINLLTDCLKRIAEFPG